MQFDFHGVRLILEGDPAVETPLARDFAWFRFEGSCQPDVFISARLGRGPRIPPARAVMQRPDCAVYDVGGRRWVDYQGEALAVLDPATDRAELWGEDPDRLAEVAYLLALSRIGERLDRKGLHRLHALAFALGGRTCAVLLPEGGGKSTLALALLERTDARLLSEDAPLCDPGGRLLPFPLRIAVREGRPLPFPERFVRTFVRRRHGVKKVLDLEAFRNRIGEAAPITDLLIGLRTAGEAGIEPVSGWAAFRGLLPNLIFGLGLPQVVEYFLRGDLGDLTGKTCTVLSRTRRAAVLARRARTGRLLLSPDPDANVRALSGWLGQV